MIVDCAHYLDGKRCDEGVMPPVQPSGAPGARAHPVNGYEFAIAPVDPPSS